VQGASLGNYRVEELLGQGGMGVVYVGRHEKLGHRVAVKVLRAEMSRNADMVRRFFNEAQAATAIRNAGIVQVFDFGTTPDGCAYFVMEMLEGESLSARLKERLLDAVESCRLARQIANVLQSAHTAGITHRDLKPDNLFLVPDAEVAGGERVKVLDFGIAKLAGEVHAAGVHTRADLVMGTPSYMSPEQCRGAGAVDTRADIYSLGCVLFKMVCGRAPFVGEGPGDILGAHLHVPPPSLLDFAPNAPPALAALVARTLEKQPAARPQTMAAVSQALDEILREILPQVRPSMELPMLPRTTTAAVAAVSPAAAAAVSHTAAPVTMPPMGSLSPATPASSFATTLPTSSVAAAIGGDEPPQRLSSISMGTGGLSASTPLAPPPVTPSGGSVMPSYERAPGMPPAAQGAGAGLGASTGPGTMTTLGGSAGVSSVQARSPARRPWLRWSAGLLGAAGAAVAVTLLLASNKSGPESGTRQMSYREISAGATAPAAKVTGDTGSAPPAPSPSAQAAPSPSAQAAPGGAAETAAATTPPRPPADDLESECKGLSVDRKWAELEQCADKLAATAPQAAEAFKTRAAVERKVLAQVAVFDAALRDQNLRRARNELEQIRVDSAELPKLKARYEEAEKQAVNELALRLERAVTPDCAAYNAILAKERGTQVSRVVDMATRRTPCSAISRAQCDAKQLAEEAQKLHSTGKLTAALAKYDESWYCKQDSTIARQGFIVACIVPSAQRARLFWKRLPASMRAAVIGHCTNNDITQQQLDAP
jgi:serine/threonine protein kinase